MKSPALVFSAVLLLAASAFAQEAGYLRYLPDVPLMAGMSEQQEQAMIFDKAEGRVIESIALAGTSSAKDVQEFYQRTLPQLGWKQASPQRFLRNDEQLIVKWEKLPDGPIVRFSVSPKQGQSPEKNF